MWWRAAVDGCGLLSGGHRKRENRVGLRGQERTFTELQAGSNALEQLFAPLDCLRVGKGAYSVMYRTRVVERHPREHPCRTERPYRPDLRNGERLFDHEDATVQEVAGQGPNRHVRKGRRLRPTGTDSRFLDQRECCMRRLDPQLAQVLHSHRLPRPTRTRSRGALNPKTSPTLSPGTNGLTGAADGILILTKSRGSADGE